MKKIISITAAASIIASFVMAAGVSAAGTGNVLTLEAEQDATTGELTFSGTTDPSVVAVSCSLLDSTDSEVFFGSLSVDAATFSGSSVFEVKDYTLKCANYNGGDWVSVSIAQPASATEEDGANSPETGYMTRSEDYSAIANYLPAIVLAVLIASAALIGAVATILIKRNKSVR